MLVLVVQTTTRYANWTHMLTGLITTSHGVVVLRASQDKFASGL